MVDVFILDCNVIFNEDWWGCL